MDDRTQQLDSSLLRILEQEARLHEARLLITPLLQTLQKELEARGQYRLREIPDLASVRPELSEEQLSQLLTLVTNAIRTGQVDLLPPYIGEFIEAVPSRPLAPELVAPPISKPDALKTQETREALLDRAAIAITRLRAALQRSHYVMVDIEPRALAELDTNRLQAIVDGVARALDGGGRRALPEFIQKCIQRQPTISERAAEILRSHPKKIIAAVIAGIAALYAWHNVDASRDEKPIDPREVLEQLK